MRRAFIMGSNGPENLNPLKYASCDADRMARTLALPRNGFDVITPPEACDTFTLRRWLYSAAEDCSEGDTFVCFFAGHGFLEKGSLFLLWNDTKLDRLLGTSLPASDIMQALKFCKADDKLLILDCCHAGAVVHMTGLRDATGIPIDETEIKPENHLVLMASDRLERAREIAGRSSGFMTSEICAALTYRFNDADSDGDGRLSMNDLKGWLEQQARIHNREYPQTPVPIPYLFGQQRGTLFLTKSISEWLPFSVAWPDDSTMMVLPLNPDRYGGAICMARHPITNIQYARFLESLSSGEVLADYYLENFPASDPLHYQQRVKEVTEPIGKEYRVSSTDGKGQWLGPFYPWRDELFNSPTQPVVCVSYTDALVYCAWVNRLSQQNCDSTNKKVTFLPGVALWDFAAFGTEYPTRRPDTWLHTAKVIHHQSSAPAAVDESGERHSRLGLSDMIGNVWEWCVGSGGAHPSFAALPDFLDTQFHHAELRGGGFVDDLRKVEVFFDSVRLKDNKYTRHSDIGFRICGLVPVDELPESVAAALETYRNPPDLGEISMFAR